MKLTTLPKESDWRTRIEMRRQQFSKDLRRYMRNNDAFIKCSWCWTHLHLRTPAMFFIRTIDIAHVTELYEPFCARCADQFKQSRHSIKEMTLEQGIEWYRINLVKSICEE